MRTRTTWNRDQIKQGSSRTAEDPRSMNQDHLSQQPSADKYTNGDPSSWAEDIHSPNEWEKEYSGGQTKRDEIGMPEKRPETYNHPEKTAAAGNEEFYMKKADFTVKLARMMLGNTAPESAIEDQAVNLMHVPDTALIATYASLSERLAQQGQSQEEKDQEQTQQKQAALQLRAQKAFQAGDLAGAKLALDEALAMPAPTATTPVDTSTAPSTSVAAPAAMQSTQAPAVSADIMQVVQAAVTAALKQAGVLRANDQQMPQQQQVSQQQMPQMQQSQQQMPQQQVSQQAPPMQQQSDDALLDDLMGGMGGGDMSESDIELDAPPMDLGDGGEMQLGPEDDVLRTLFATQESQDAEQAQQDQQGAQQQKQAGMGRTASTRTVGTRPTGGVSRVGGGVAGSGNRSGNDIDKLSALWPSAPDVRDAFNMK